MDRKVHSAWRTIAIISFILLVLTGETSQKEWERFERYKRWTIEILMERALPGDKYVLKDGTGIVLPDRKIEYRIKTDSGEKVFIDTSFPTAKIVISLVLSGQK